MAALTREIDMPVETRARYIDGWLGILAVFAFVWGLVNLAGLALSITEDAQSLSRSFSPEQVAYLIDTPIWARIARALSIMFLLAGSTYLLLRRQSAYHWFSAALFMMLVMMLDGLFRGGFGLLASITTGLNIGYLLLTLFLFWSAYSAKQSGQLR
jgi:hypothetical protein